MVVVVVEVEVDDVVDFDEESLLVDDAVVLAAGAGSVLDFAERLSVR